MDSFVYVSLEPDQFGRVKVFNTMEAAKAYGKAYTRCSAFTADRFVRQTEEAHNPDRKPLPLNTPQTFV